MMAAQGIAMSTLTVPNSQSATAPQSLASASATNASSTLSGAPASSSTTTTNPSSTTTFPTSNQNQKSKSPTRELLTKTWKYKWLGLFGFVVSIIALRYTIRADALATWTGRKDFREGCFADMVVIGHQCA